MDDKELTEGTEILYSRTGNREQDKILLQPFQYILQVPGKKIRTKMSAAFDYWMKIPPKKLVIIGDVVQLLHNASLLVDDIEDNSVLRRGIPVAHSIYGVASTINAANYVYFIALEKALELNHSKVTQVFTEQVLELHRGQGMEIYWRDNFIRPSEKEYKQVIVRKTGGLFGLAIRLMQLFSDRQHDFTELMGLLGLYFQIRDDYANLCMTEYAESKSFGEDLTEGKFSFPVIHAIHSRPEDKQIINIIRQRTKNIEVKKYCVTLLEKRGSLDYTKQVLQELDNKAREEIKSLGGNPYLETVLDELKNW